MKKGNFTLHKFKLLKKGVEVSYTEPRGDTEDRISIEGDKYPHEDLINLLLTLKEPLANVFGFVMEDVEDLVHPTGIHISGTGNKQAFIITGTFKTELGTVAINTPRIPVISDMFPWIDDIVKEDGLIDQLKEEIYQYFVKSKNSQLQIPFDTEVQKEED